MEVGVDLDGYGKTNPIGVGTPKSTTRNQSPSRIHYPGRPVRNIRKPGKNIHFFNVHELTADYLTYQSSTTKHIMSQSDRLCVTVSQPFPSRRCHLTFSSLEPEYVILYAD